MSLILTCKMSPIPSKLETYVATELRLGPNIYPMTALNRGYCVIIDNTEFDNHKERLGSRNEAERLKTVFSWANFTVILERDLTGSNMAQLLDKISQSPDLISHNALVVIVLSHGGSNGVICGKDYKKLGDIESGFVTDLEIIGKFDDENCKGLKGKPKIFFLSCCRGSKFSMNNMDRKYYKLYFHLNYLIMHRR